MIKKLKQSTLSVAASAVLASSTFAYDTINITTDTTIDPSDTYNYNISDAVTLTLDRGADFGRTYFGVISGQGSIMKTGIGIVSLEGHNTYTGNTDIIAGTLELWGGNAIADTGIINVQNGSTLSIFASETVGEIFGSGDIILSLGNLTTGIDGNYSLSGILSGYGELTKTGSGVLTLSGTNTYTGATTVNGGTLAVTGDSTSSDFTVNSGGTLGGSGSVGDTLVKSGGTLYPSSTATLGITGNLTFENGSIYKINASSTGANGKVTVSGTANLDGTVEVKADNSGTWAKNTDFTVLSASSIVGTFDSVSTDLAFLTPTLGYESDKVKLTMTRNDASYKDKATSSIGKATATILGNITTPNADMQTLITVINGMNDTQADKAFTQLGGATLTNGTINLSSSVASTFNNSMGSRLASLDSKSRGLDGLRFVDNGNPESVFKNLLDKDLVVNEDGFLSKKRDIYDVWARVIGGKTSNDGDSIISATDTKTGGIQGGFDKKSDDMTIGLSLGFLKSDTDFANNEATSETKSTLFGLYGAKKYGKINLTATASVGKNDGKSTRLTPTGWANSDTTSLSYSGDLRLGYEYSVGENLSLEPTVVGAISKLTQDAYSETGATGANLSMEQYSTLTKTVGVELKGKQKFVSNNKTIGSLEVGIGYLKESGDLNKPMSASFSAAPTAGSFSISGVEKDKYIKTASILGTYEVAKLTDIFVSFNGSKRDNEESINGTLGIRIGF